MIEMLWVPIVLPFILMGLAWFFYLLSGNPGIVDVFWGVGIAAIAVACALVFPVSLSYGLLLGAVFAWTLRLSVFLWWTRIRPGEKDPRYTQLFGGNNLKGAVKSFGNFMLQAVLQLPVASVFFVAAISEKSGFLGLGLIVAVVGIVIESVADLQLHHFKSQKTGTLCRNGLWGYSRHPNYFGEIVVWIGFALMVVSDGWGILAIVSPITVWVIVRFVTGPYTERVSVARKGAVYRDYQQSTPMILPKFPIAEWLLASVNLPDNFLRWGIRRELYARLRVESGFLRQSGAAHKEAHVQILKNSPIAIYTDAANEQHYEVPAAFFEQVLGTNLKYSSGLYLTPDADLDEAELAMLALSCERAMLSDGQQVLELGCGWGSLTLYMAKYYPNSQITAVSNSASQKLFIDTKCRERSLHNVSVITADIASVNFDVTFDRIVSVEMFEHVRNYEALFQKCASWLTDDGCMFVHVFGHRELAYLFDTADSWMAKYFFAGGQMPSFDLFLNFQSHLTLQSRWAVSGQHYAKTCRGWLVNMDRTWPVIAPVFDTIYGPKAAQFRRYWRLFFMSCEELFAWDKGNAWQVYHYRFCKKALR